MPFYQKVRRNRDYPSLHLLAHLRSWDVSRGGILGSSRDVAKGGKVNTLKQIIRFERGFAVNNARTRYIWYLYIGGLCVGEIEGSVQWMQERLDDIHKEIEKASA